MDLKLTVQPHRLHQPWYWCRNTNPKHTITKAGEPGNKTNL